MRFRNDWSLNGLVLVIVIALCTGESQGNTLNGTVLIQLNPNSHPIYIHTPFEFVCRILSQDNDFDTCQFEHGPFNVPQIGSYNNITKRCIFPPPSGNKAARIQEGKYKCRVCDGSGDCTVYANFTLRVREDGGWGPWYRRNMCVDENKRDCNNPSARNGGICRPQTWLDFSPYRTERNCEWIVKEQKKFPMTLEYKGTAHLNERHHNHVVPPNLLQTRTFYRVRSRIECAVMCTSDIACNTYTFNPDFDTCRFTLR